MPWKEAMIFSGFQSSVARCVVIEFASAVM